MAEDMAEAVAQQQSTPLAGQIAVVTGAGRGIGEAVALILARMGAQVVLTGRDRIRLERVKATIEESSGRALTIPCDLTDDQAIAALGRRILGECGRCDILVNNAGIGIQGKPLVEFAPEEWDRMINTNLRAPYLMIRALAPMMIAAKSGHIINISSLAGRNPLPNGAAYAASKWGLNGLTYSVAEELRPHNVRVAVIAPGSVNTRFGVDSATPDGSTKDPAKMIQPGDVARMVATLVTEAPNCFTSEVLMRPTIKP
jgi:3-oxoacyl-[acyl-carrier protein] reductase